MTDKELDNVFTYHKPTKAQEEKFGVIRAGAYSMAAMINRECPDSREKAYAMANLQQAFMWAKASIELNE